MDDYYIFESLNGEAKYIFKDNITIYDWIKPHLKGVKVESTNPELYPKECRKLKTWEIVKYKLQGFITNE